MSNSVRPHRRQPTRLPRPWDSPGKDTGVGCHFLPQCIKVKSESEIALSCPTLSDPMDCSPPGSSVHGIFQARVLEWGAIAFSAAGYTIIYLNNRPLSDHPVVSSSLLSATLLQRASFYSESFFCLSYFLKMVSQKWKYWFNYRFPFYVSSYILPSCSPKGGPGRVESILWVVFCS